MKGAPIRAAIVVVAVAVASVVLAKGFTAGGPLIGPPSQGSHPSSTTSPTTSASPTASKSTNPTPAGRVHGVILAIFNTTTVVGLAACAAIDLSKKGYVVPASSVLQAPAGSTAPETAIFYRDAQGKADAELLANGYFKSNQPKVRHLESTADVPKRAELAIFLGTQYASGHQGGC